MVRMRSLTALSLVNRKDGCRGIKTLMRRLALSSCPLRTLRWSNRKNRGERGRSAWEVQKKCITFVFGLALIASVNLDTCKGYHHNASCFTKRYWSPGVFSWFYLFFWQSSHFQRMQRQNQLAVSCCMDSRFQDILVQTEIRISIGAYCWCRHAQYSPELSWHVLCSFCTWKLDVLIRDILYDRIDCNNIITRQLLKSLHIIY